MDGKTVWELFRKIEEAKPLVHCITNIVTVNDCANILLAAGASPTMAHHEEETAQITAASRGLVCNLGATENFEAMRRSVRAAKEAKIPVVVDPVGCGGSSLRRAFFRELLKIGITCVRGNYSEIRALALDAGTTAGVDARDEGEDIRSVAEQFAKRHGILVIASGARDIVTDGTHTMYVDNGDAWMARVTGTGCMSSVLLGAFLSASDGRKDWVVLGAACCIVMGICGELAKEECISRGGGTMTYRMLLLDQVSLLRETDIKDRMRMTDFTFWP